MPSTGTKVPPSRFDPVLLDLDGTILDTHALILSSFRHVRDTFGLDADDAAFQAEIGRPLVDIFARWAEDRGHRDALVASYRAHNDSVHDAMVTPFPGIAEALVLLREHGIALGVVTSKARSFALRGLRIAGLLDIFDVVVSADDTRRHKPDPEPVHRALEALGVAPTHALMVGDASFDILAGRSAGVTTAGVLWGGSTAEQLAGAGADHLLARADDLAALCLGPAAQ